MSVPEHLPALEAAINEHRQIQKIRKKVKIDEGIFIGLAAIRAFKTELRCEEQRQARVILKKLHGQQYLACGDITILPLDLIDYSQSVNNIVTVYLKKNDEFPFKKITFDMSSIWEVNDFIAKVKLPTKPRPNVMKCDFII